MHAEKDERDSAAIQDELTALEQVRDLLEGVDLTTRKGADSARQLLRERGLPEFLIYGAQRQSITEEDQQWAAERLAELRASGDVS
jgi:hypothetical protein